MDVKQYFKKIREIESTLGDPFPLVVSLETANGGKAGAPCEVSRSVAAQLIVEGRAALATDEQKTRFRQQEEAARRAAEKAELARRIQVAIVTDSEIETVTSTKKASQPSSGK